MILSPLIASRKPVIVSLLVAAIFRSRFHRDHCAKRELKFAAPGLCGKKKSFAGTAWFMVQARIKRWLEVGAALEAISHEEEDGHGRVRPLTAAATWSALVVLLLSLPVRAAEEGDATAPPWWRGNLHTHTLWSDGDDYPDRVVSWYKEHGYHFLVLSDHNVVQDKERWVAIDKTKSGRDGFEAYLKDFGGDWVEQREVDGVAQVRLKTLADLRPRFEAPGRFLLMTGEEISDEFAKAPLHLNAYPIAHYIAPQRGTSVVDVLQRNVDAVLAHRRESGLPSIVHINHPNFGYAITAEQLMQVRGERFFEVYNGHPSVHNEGDRYRAGLERVWDILLAFRLGELDLGPMYGLAVDDAHYYHKFDSSLSNPGRGWIMIRSPDLSPQSLVNAMEAGNFYASTGVMIETLDVTSKGLRLRIAGEPDVTYTTRFIGTRKGFDRTSRPAPPPPNGTLPVTREYSDDIGRVLSEQKGVEAAYAFQGDELYVRATVISSKAKANPYRKNETEAAWIQPVTPADLKEPSPTP